MTTKMLLLVSRFKNYSVAGTTYPYTSVSSQNYMQQIDNESYICFVTLEQNTFDCYEVLSEKKFSMGHRTVYNVSEGNFRMLVITVDHNQIFLLKMQVCVKEDVIIH